MTGFKEHCERSLELFGEDGSEYHKWLDQYSKLGYWHRRILHNKEGVEVGVQLFGEAARKHLEQHIKDDFCTDEVPKIEDLKDGNDFLV